MSDLLTVHEMSDEDHQQAIAGYENGSHLDVLLFIHCHHNDYVYIEMVRTTAVATILHQRNQPKPAIPAEKVELGRNLPSRWTAKVNQERNSIDETLCCQIR